jgi:hypothetical protein
MNTNITAVRPQDLRLIDLVLEPLVYAEALRGPLHTGLLDGMTVTHLETLLPRAILQLDAIGDEHGAIALASLQDSIAPALAI